MDHVGYLVSSEGRIKGVRGWVLRPFTCGIGYVGVKLRKDGKNQNFYVHQLVAEAFHGPRPAGRQVAHYDGNRSNNRADNLRYATPVENGRDRVRHGTNERPTCRVPAHVEQRIVHIFNHGFDLSDHSIGRLSGTTGPTARRVLARNGLVGT